MITQQIAQQLGIVSNIPYPIENPVFISQHQLWKKQSLSAVLMQSYKKPNKYEFYKIGKTLKLQTTRFIALIDKYLVYYDDNNTDQISGYCDLQNVYVYYLRSADSKYILYLTNGIISSKFYFHTSEFLSLLKPKIQQHIIQLNFNEKYSIIDLLGHGSFSKVYLAKSLENGMLYAAKIVGKKDKNKNQTSKCVEEQKKVLTILNKSPNIYNFYQFYQENDNYVFILEYLPGKDLMTLIKSKTQFTYPQCIAILQQILIALNHLHNANIIHRDIKPQNIILDSHSIKLIDFGLSLLVHPGLQHQQFKRCGTMGYMAPQVIDSNGDRRKYYDFKCDVFSFGIVAHILLFGKNPLKGKNYEQTCQLNRQCKILLNQQQIKQKYGCKCYEMLSAVLIKNPKARPSAKQVLNMPIFKQCQLNSKITFLPNNSSNDQISTSQNKLTNKYNIK